MDLNTFNTMPETEAHDVLVRCLAVPRWADDVLSRRPYADSAALLDAAALHAATLTDDELDEALAGLRAQESWPETSYDGSRRSLAALKNVTSDLIGRFCGAVQHATHTASDGPFVRYAADLVVPEQTRLEIAVLKGIAAHYVMQAQDRIDIMVRQRELIAELVAVLLDRGEDALEPSLRDDWRGASDDAARRRVVVDQVASLTDVSALSWHTRLCRGHA